MNKWSFLGSKRLYNWLFFFFFIYEKVLFIYSDKMTEKKNSLRFSPFQVLIFV